MQLNDDERAMLDGRDGAAVQRAMDLLVRYGEALDAPRLVDTNNVCGTVGATMPFLRDFAARHGGLDAVFSEFNLDSPEVVEVPKAKVFSSHLQQGLDPQHAQRQGIDGEIVKLYRQGEAFTGRLGIQPLNTCAPYLTGNVPVRGEHCAWMESSAVIYINAVLGARTNAEGRESTGAAMLTGKIPYWGLHLDENRGGTHLIELDIDVKTVQDWGLLGYYVGELVQDRIPVIDGLRDVPNLPKLKHFGAAAASSGGVEMYHIVGQTPEARTRDEAFRGRKPLETIRYGAAERRLAYERVNTTAKDAQVDFVMLGCPHYSIEQIWEVCQLLEGRRIGANTELWIFTARATRQLADQAGYTKLIEDAGGVLMTDTCSAIGRVMPKGTRVVALDSAKQAHYLPAIMGVQAWFGTTADCIEAAVSGRWNGGLAA
ncbi:aconitase X catalytic domain-containing protein [Paraburkholderia sp. MMS20-SJTR3]|uniref:Aconitase X catalytic domain-containing protein n=1 Tax=Paraburkholderia sejongensis TaxID=2886946 RepID=A0ABS8JP09_9BURK|nr:aconitase X catalytic domain-containing protein [Paraburkholderia sp. MMS20-SJTR3]MCC8391485.1 aconitase X catalytic domain-containing protein [Paraburkholderia sp. MMS20-SJTR3]